MYRHVNDGVVPLYLLIVGQVVEMDLGRLAIAIWLGATDSKLNCNWIWVLHSGWLAVAMRIKI